MFAKKMFENLRHTKLYETVFLYEQDTKYTLLTHMYLFCKIKDLNCRNYFFFIEDYTAIYA